MQRVRGVKGSRGKTEPAKWYEIATSFGLAMTKGNNLAYTPYYSLSTIHYVTGLFMLPVL